MSHNETMQTRTSYKVQEILNELGIAGVKYNILPRASSDCSVIEISLIKGDKVTLWIADEIERGEVRSKDGILLMLIVGGIYTKLAVFGDIVILMRQRDVDSFNSYHVLHLRVEKKTITDDAGNKKVVK